MDGFDFDRLSTDDLQSEITRIERLHRRLSAYQAEMIAEVDRRQVPLADGARTLTDWVTANLDISRDNAKDLVTLSKTLPNLPLLAKGLAEGECSVERAATLSRVATTDTESEWWDRTWGHDLAGVERLVRRHRRITLNQERRDHSQSHIWIQPRLDRTWWNIHGGLPALAGQAVSEALRSHANQYPKEAGSLGHRQALALEELCTTNTGDTGKDGTGPAITAFVDLDVANGTGGEAGTELAAGPRIGPDALGELLCTGSVGIVGLKNAKPVTTSRRSRTIPKAIRDFVLWRDGGCTAKGCNSRNRLQPHHVIPWSHGGDHNPDHLKTLCWYHHIVVVHRSGLKIRTEPDGSIRFVAPADNRDPP